MDSSAMGHITKSVIHTRTTQNNRVAWIAAASALAFILLVLTSCVIYLFLRNLATDTALRNTEMAVKDIEGNLERYAQAYWLRFHEDEKHAAMLNSLKNESKMLQAQLAESVARNDEARAAFAKLNASTEDIKLELANIHAKENETASLILAVIKQNKEASGTFSKINVSMEELRNELANIITKGSETASHILNLTEQKDKTSMAFARINASVEALQVKLSNTDAKGNETAAMVFTLMEQVNAVVQRISSSKSLRTSTSGSGSSLRLCKDPTAIVLLMLFRSFYCECLQSGYTY